MARGSRFDSAEFESVLTAAQVGAGWALERLYVAYGGAVDGYLRMQGVREHEDLTSEVFLGAFRTIGRFAGTEDAFRGWLFTIAHRRVIDSRRRKSRRPDVPLDDPITSDLRADDDVEDSALQAIGTARVRQLCTDLVPDQRSVLLMRLIGGLTVEEVAAALDKTPGAVKQLQRRGVLALKRKLEREGVPL